MFCKNMINNSCTKINRQCADVSIPLDIEPTADIEDIKISCYEAPCISFKKKCDNKCSITITQRICLDIPITYSVSTNSGDLSVDCESCGCED